MRMIRAVIRGTTIILTRRHTRQDGASTNSGRTEDEHERRARGREKEETKRTHRGGTKRGRTPPN